MKTYFLEIRNRILLLIFVWLTVILVCYTFKEILLLNIIKQSFYLEEPFYLIFTDVSEIFYVYIILIFFVGNQVLVLYFLYHIFIFVAPSLFTFEYKSFAFIFKICLAWFFFSIIIFSNFFFPICWNFFLSFQNLELIKETTLYFESKINEYILFYTSSYYTFIFCCQLLALLFIIFDSSKANTELIQKFRKFFYYFFIIFSTLVTPPDVFSQLFLSFCLIFSYEILVFYFIYKKINSF